MMLLSLLSRDFCLDLPDTHLYTPEPPHEPQIVSSSRCYKKSTAPKNPWALIVHQILLVMRFEAAQLIRAHASIFVPDTDVNRLQIDRHLLNRESELRA
jgi:hypothetical protein